MDVRITDAGLPIVEPLRPPRGAPQALIKALAEDTIAEFTASIATGHAANLVRVIEAERFSPAPSVVETLLQTIVKAIEHHDVPGALGGLAELIERDPDHASAIVEMPALQPIHSQARELLHRVTQIAHDEAALAAGAFSISAPQENLALDLVARLIATGQLPGYIRASELCRRLERPATLPSPGAPRKFQAIVTRMWHRAPLLVLLFGWFAAGLVLMLILQSEAAAAVWGIGFLVLVVLQFLITTRNR